MHRAIVSGITGHLGRAVSDQLVAAGVNVLGLTRRATVIDGAWPEAVQLHSIDGRTETLIGVFETFRPDVVFHLAGLSRRQHLSADILPFVEANIVLGTQLLEAMRLTGCHRIITAGSYLQHLDGDCYRAANLYAATKQAFEDIVAYYVDTYRLAAVRLTLGDIYSEHDTRRKLMTDIASGWANATPLHIRDEHAYVDLVHVNDAAAAFLRAADLLENNVISRGTFSRYSVSTGMAVTSRELVALFERLGRRTLGVTYGEGDISSLRTKPWHGPAVPGWRPRVSLEEGISRILSSSRKDQALSGIYTE